MRKPAPKLNRQSGIATVELAFSLIILIVLSFVFIQYSVVYIRHSQITYGAFIGERSRVVGGDAVGAGNMVSRASVYTELNETVVRDYLNLPVNLNTPWTKNRQDWLVERRISMPTEPLDIGDNESFSRQSALTGIPAPKGGLMNRK